MGCPIMYYENRTDHYNMKETELVEDQECTGSPLGLPTDFFLSARMLGITLCQNSYALRLFSSPARQMLEKKCIESFAVYIPVVLDHARFHS